MGQPVLIPKFDLPANKPHWAIRLAWMSMGLLLLSVVGLAAVVMHRRSLETQAEIAKAEAIAKAKADAEAKVAAAAAAARAAKEAEIHAREQKLAAARAAKEAAVAAAKAEAEAAADAKAGAKGTRRSHGRLGKGGKLFAKTSTKPSDGKTRVSDASGSSKRGDAVIDDILSKMK